jgi:hypothetical protein
MGSCEKVCFIGGAGHSGSTLLGLVLGAHPGVFYAGEARKSLFLDDERQPLRKRTCKVCGVGCKVWTGLRTAPDEDLYEALARRTGRPTIVDSTKEVTWIDAQAQALAARRVPVHLFFLGRDGRAVVASGLRKHPETSARDQARRWVAQIEATEALAARFPGPVTRVRYEALATRPRETIADLAGALALEPSPAMQDPWRAEHHPLGGNAGTQALLEGAQTRVGGALPVSGGKRSYYATHPREFALDLRWQRELGAGALADFEAVAGATNRQHAWDGEALDAEAPR